MDNLDRLNEGSILADEEKIIAHSQSLPYAELPQTLPILPLRGLVVYPQTAVPLNVGQPRSIRLLESTHPQNGFIGLCASYDRDRAAPGPEEIYRIGTIATVHRQLRRKDGTVRMLVNGLHRFRIKSFIATDPFLVAQIEPLPEDISGSNQTEAMARNLVEMFMRLAEFVPSIPGDLLASSLNLDNPLQLVYTVATYLQLELSDAQQLLEFNKLAEKLAWLVSHIGKETEILEMGQRIRSEAFGQIEQAQREYFLREQLKAIHRELGEADEREVEAQAFRAKIGAANMPPEAEQEAERELSRLTRLPVAAAEYGVVRTYLEWLVSLPWNTTTTDNLDLNHARAVLDEDHHGLVEVKERIVEFLAVRGLRQRRQLEKMNRGEVEDTAVPPHYSTQFGAILCFVGPPGVGKTSLGRSIARAMGRQFARISLGGMRDEAEIRGHRRTYIGALPGRIMQMLRRSGSKNPVIILDEIDKLGADFRGDPASALLEVLDPEQNCAFRDHYLDVPFDLSSVMFITTANTLDTVPSPLRDRMEIIQLAGYIESEKVAIAQNYLLPRQLQENGLLPDELAMDTAVLQHIIQNYTREAGVRELERQIGRICRKVATAVAEHPENNPTSQLHIAPDQLVNHLGPVRYSVDAARRTSIAGVATGLAWTSTGGHILFIEAAKMTGKKSLIITGQLGGVMQESVQAALTFVRSKAEQLGVDPDFFDQHDIHIHIPAGAIPKDGPSAGITVATALASLLSKRPVCHHTAMTGEITLLGQVMPVGGIKEKVLAAHRAGLRTIILPYQNEPDLTEIPEEIKETMSFVLAHTMDDVLQAALCTE